MACRQRQCPGFTMMELLVAIAILSVIMAIVYSSFASVLDTTDVARESAEVLRFRQFLWRSFTTNLTSIYTDPGCEMTNMQLLGANEEGYEGPADSLRFCTALPLSGPTALPGILRIVTYSVVDAYEAAEGESVLGQLAIEQADEESGAGLLLSIKEEPLILENPDFEPDLEEAEKAGIERKVPISTLDIEYYDGANDEWVEEWDSVAQQRMPWAIHIKINFTRNDEELQAVRDAGIDLMEEPDLDMTLALPVGVGVVEPFVDLNHKRLVSLVEEETDAFDLE